MRPKLIGLFVFMFVAIVTLIIVDWRLLSSISIGVWHETLALSTKASTQKQQNGAVERFYRRVLVDAYKSHGKRDPRWDSAVLEYLDEHIRHILYASTTVEIERMWPRRELLEKAKNVVKLGCDDPMVLSCCGADMRRFGEWKAGEPILRKAKAGIENSGYAQCVETDLLFNLADSIVGKDDKHKNERRGLRDAGAESLIKSLSDGSFHGGDLGAVVLYTGYTFDCAGEKIDRLLDAVNKGPEPDLYAAEFIQGICYVSKAWEARGGDWARNVTEEGWRGFETNLIKARDVLTAAWKSHPEYPYAPTEMITVAMGGHANSGETPRTWFDRAVAAQMDYMPAYRYYLWAIRPRWGGSHGRMYSFGCSCLETGRFDTNIPLVFLYALRKIDDDVPGHAKQWKTDRTKRALKEMEAGYVKSGSLDPEFLNSLRIGIAWRLGEKSRALKLIEDSRNHVRTDVFNAYFGRYLNEIEADLKSRDKHSQSAETHREE